MILETLPMTANAQTIASIPHCQKPVIRFTHTGVYVPAMRMKMDE
jgi:hypothetical protein